MSALNARTESALDDIIAARMPGLGDIGRLTLKCMVMDLLFLEATKAFANEHPELIPFFQAFSGELASRTQALMNTNSITKDKQKEFGTQAKQMASELMQLFASRVLAPTQ